jgi:hypothetical protein
LSRQREQTLLATATRSRSKSFASGFPGEIRR